MTTPAPKPVHTCPTTPESDDPEKLGFKRRPMVDWMGPAQLARTGVKAVLSSLFGSYADKRETMAALDREAVVSEDYSAAPDGEIWIDYVADLGDGFDATYSLARLLAAPELTLRHGGASYPTRRGRALVMGGDQVYPTADYKEYWDRLYMPYTAALPCVTEGVPPNLFAVPGNHDWYDGLNSFSRFFCQEGWLGGWKTRQKRSYFTVKLPHKWWIWGIDIQLAGFIDKPQLDYFYSIWKDHIEPGDRVILCTAEPAWVYGVTKGPEAFRSLAFFEDRYVRRDNKASLKVSLTGDLHHYVRYESADKVQRVTAGGGGAYLYATHEMPEKLALQEGFRQTARTVEYQQQATFPDTKDSWRLSFGCLRLPWRSRGFGLFLAGLYSLYAWVVQSASKSLSDVSFMETLSGLPFSWTGFKGMVGGLFDVLAHSPASVLYSLAIVGGLVGFCAAKKTPVKLAVGTLHGLAHIALCLLLVWLAARVNPVYVGPIDSSRQVLAFLAEMVLLGGVLGSFLMALYLLLCSILGKFHTNEVFSSQRMAGYKNFLRLHVGTDGALTIFPVGIKSVCEKWRLNPKAKNGEPWFEPEEPLEPELIEPPIRVS